MLPACKTAKNETSTVKIEQRENSRWKNVTIPVRLELVEPQRLTIAGRLTMVRNEYALISMRMLGLEVAQIYVDPQEADVVVKQMNKIWIQEPIASHLERLNLPFSTLQKALMGNKEAFDKLPAGLGLSLDGTDERPVVNLKLTARGKTIAGNMTLNMNEAKWNMPTFDSFKKPQGSEYKKVSLKDLGKTLK